MMVTFDEKAGATSVGRVDMPLISIVVPVYNVSCYIDECLESISRQTYENIEVIMVDDGSTDGSSEKCQSWTDKDPRFRLLRKPNSGPSDARNAGLSVASGKYVSFIDSDDMISPVYLEVMYGAIQKCGSRIASLNRPKAFTNSVDPTLFDDSCIEDTIDLAYSISAESYIEKLLYQRCETGIICRLYERDVLGDYPFPSGVYYEDVATPCVFARNAGRVCIVDCDCLYLYRKRENSIMRSSYSQKKTISALQITHQLFEDISAWYPRLSEAAASRCFSVCRQVFSQTPINYSSDRELLWKEMTRYRLTIIVDVDARKRERFAAAITFLGQRIFTGFCALYRKMGYSA